MNGLTAPIRTQQADDDARELLDRYFQSVVRAAPDPEVSEGLQRDGELKPTRVVCRHVSGKRISWKPFYCKSCRNALRDLSSLAGSPRVHCVHRPDGRAPEPAAGVGRPSA